MIYVINPRERVRARVWAAPDGASWEITFEDHLARGVWRPWAWTSESSLEAAVLEARRGVGHDL